MTPRGLPVLLGLLGASAVPLVSGSAQEPGGLEFGVQGMTVLEDPAWTGGVLYGAYRPGGKTRLAITLGPGTLAGTLAARGELLAHFVLAPGRTRGVSVYGLGGIATVVGPQDQGYLVIGLGLERGPGGRSGWAVEAGVGGGARIAVGWRWRWLAPPRRREP